MREKFIVKNIIEYEENINFFMRVKHVRTCLDVIYQLTHQNLLYDESDDHVA